ncbi:DUF134 domain-containing protein [Plesiomonas shigelloides]|uniref:DUF134 domain-containing protein n=1 Tax=Plesiomonas shigelloides TaxID=703 RepID=UPI0012624ACD|nr:DUF134 domain-containing protein [Plesiomonas shigelloides]KAB7713720.1 DUF134 domain-containing protein [Plesiomonas shigelloides]
MVRPKKPRCICSHAPFTLFKPNGIPASQLTLQQLKADEFEALRLADLMGLQQIQAAALMGVSRQTFANLVKEARRKIAACLVHGQGLQLERIPDDDHCDPAAE